MGNIATNTIQQLEKLNSRGMDVDYSDEKVKEILLDIGYYRLGFYWNPFEINGNYQFREGTKLSDVVKLYYLDVDLRNLLIKYINRIEINFRTKLVYYVSNKHKYSPTWFIHPDIMFNSFISSFDQHYSDEFKRNNKPIKLHHNKYINDKYAPAWKTLEFFTFGVVLKIFKSLKDNDIQERISKCYEIRNLKKFINLFETIVYIRNVCSHGGVLFDLNTPKGISILPGINFNDNNRHSLDSTIKIILFILGKISESRKTELETRIKELFESHKDNEVLKSIIENKIGYEFE
ncbi:Abi family protein [Sinomicrobium kalidii]|uniref:Abi family protein n=1 Tax=Sinomicrobium kalidii TaxID=2900738 RepID=UPI001E2BE649|nr:Abi family protein [Sinomicrobium kalidii]UGU14243.1 Abi family protein [Sinomicrobium kalidii]